MTTDEPELNAWFDSQKRTLEEAYIQHDEPWKQSGFSGPEDRWIRCRKPISDCIEESGSFLDIGCANGYLLECVLRWTGERGLTVVPFGLDISEKLVELAKSRLHDYRENICVGNAWSWNNPIRYDYVRTELVYVPEPLYKQYVRRILDLFLTENGRLLITEYRSRGDDINKPWIDKYLEEWGFQISRQVSGFYDSKELTRVCVISK